MRIVLIRSLFVAFLMLAPSMANAQINPCHAFAFFLMNQGWKDEFKKVSLYYQQRLAQASTSEQKNHYQTIMDRILDCHTERSKLRKAPIPLPASEISSAYDLFESKLHAYPRGLNRSMVFKAEKQVAHKGISRQDLEEFKKYHPALEKAFDESTPVPKTYVSETDAALYEFLAFLQKEYPKSTFLSERKVWGYVFRSSFESELIRFSPDEALKRALRTTRAEFSEELLNLGIKLDQTMSFSGELKLLFNRDDLFLHFFEEHLFQNEVLKAAWEDFGNSYLHVLSDPEPQKRWIDWINTLTQEDHALSVRLRDGPRAITNAVELDIIKYRTKYPTGSMIITDLGSQGRLLPSEAEAFQDLEIARATVNSSKVDRASGVRAFLNPQFETATSLEEVTKMMHVYSAVCEKSEFLKAALIDAKSENILTLLEKSEYAKTSGKTGFEIAAEVAGELKTRFEATRENQAANAEGFRRLIRDINSKLTEMQKAKVKIDFKSIKSTALVYASAYAGREQIDVFRFDDFYAKNMALTKKALGFIDEKKFIHEYKTTLLSECPILLNPYRAIKIIFGK